MHTAASWHGEHRTIALICLAYVLAAGRRGVPVGPSLRTIAIEIKRIHKYLTAVGYSTV
jgi:hypothetical protein